MPKVVQNATNMRTKDVIRKQIKSHNKKKTKGRTKKQNKQNLFSKWRILQVVVSGVYKKHLMVLKVLKTLLLGI